MSDRTPAIVARLEDVALADRALVGGKGASLGELTRAGLRVPRGFVVTTKAFEAHLAACDPDGSIRRRVAALDAQDLAALAALTHDARRLIADGMLREDVRVIVAGAHAALCGADADAPLAVRSSATSEDGADASFAGLQETQLWMRGFDPVVRALRSCWASLYRVESVAYRRRLGLPERQVAMAVVVQCMVSARCSGVMFTRSPTTGDRSVIAIEASWGFGSALVSGEVTPDRYVLSKVTGEIVQRTVSRKEMRHEADPAAGGTRTVAVPAAMQSIACLDDAELGELARTGRDIERHYGSAQDIEWAIGDDQHIYILQSRPETVWASRDAGPVARPAARPFDHVIATLGRRRGTDDSSGS